MTALRPRHLSCAIALVVGLASAGSPQTPDFSVHIWGYVIEDFSVRVARYLELRTRLEEGLPPLVVTDDPADITRAEVALARRLRHARHDEPGEIFTPAITLEFRRALRLRMYVPTLAAVMDENPGVFKFHVNGTYPKEKQVSTVPADILSLLPELPDDIQYRFVGPHLILHDTRANVIVDRIPCAFGCMEVQ